MVVYGNSKQESSTNGKSDNHCNSKPETFSISEKNIQLELGIRMKTRLAFDDIVSDTISRRKNDPLIDGLMVKSAIANFYESMRKDKTMESMLKERGINYQKILEEECSKTIEKYFNGDCINYNTVK